MAQSLLDALAGEAYHGNAFLQFTHVNSIEKLGLLWVGLGSENKPAVVLRGKGQLAVSLFNFLQDLGWFCALEV